MGAAKQYRSQAQVDLVTSLKEAYPDKQALKAKVRKSLRNGTEHILDFWEKYEGSGCYGAPALCQVARRLLAVQASSASSERAFSRSGLTITRFRTRLKAANASLLVKAACNNKAMERDYGKSLFEE